MRGGCMDTIASMASGDMPLRGGSTTMQSGRTPRRASSAAAAPGIGTEKFRIFDTVSLRVPARVLDRLRHDLCPDDVRGLSRQTQADRPGAAVQIQHLIRRRVDGVFHRTLIQPLGLHGIDLIESLRRECERQPAEPVGQLRLSPERIEISREHNVAFLLVDIEHDAGQLRAVLAQVGDQVVRLRAEPTCGDDAQYGVWRVHGAAREQMPHRAAAGGFVIRRNAAQIHPVADRLRRLVRERELEQALLHQA